MVFVLERALRRYKNLHAHTHTKCKWPKGSFERGAHALHWAEVHVTVMKNHRAPLSGETMCACAGVCVCIRERDFISKEKSE